MKSAADVVQQMFDAVKREDPASVMACVDPDIEVIEPATLPYGGVHHGADAFGKDVLGVLMGRLVIRFLRCEVIGREGKVVASMDLEFTSRKTGNRIVMPYVEIYTCRNEKIVRLDVYPQDTQLLNAFLAEN